MVVNNQISTDPDVSMHIDDQLKDLIIEVILPKIEKEKIKLKINARRLNLYAASAQGIYSKYIIFHQPVISDKAKITFNGGILRIVIPLL